MKCENCSAEHDGTYGSGRFCSTKCSRGFSTKSKRTEINQKVSDSLRKYPIEKECVCIICEKMFFVINRKKLKICSDECRTEYRRKNALKASVTMTLRGTHSGWHNRRGGKSYPEKYFTTLFENEGITGYVTEKKVGRWFIDFAFEDKMIAIEIDGRQHKDKERAEKDKIKDEFLFQRGWKVIRIDWYNPIDEKNKQKLYPQIEMMKQLLK